MKKKSKIIISILVALIVIICASLLFAANYLLEFAIVRTETFDENINPDSGKSNPDMETLSEDLKDKGFAWAENTPNERLEIISDDGLKLVGKLFSNSGDDYVILVHGYKGCKEDMFYTGSQYYSWGYNVLAPDNRAHGESEGKYIGMGWLDAKDILLWIDFIVKDNPNANIILHGVSMGGAAVMMVSGYDLPDNVKAIVEDCGYSSVWDIFSDELNVLFGLPDFPILHIASLLSSYKAGYSFKEASSLEQLKKSEVPILFIHGEADGFVGYYMLDLNIEAKEQGDKHVLRVKDAGHAESNKVDSELYYKTINDFISLYI